MKRILAALMLAASLFVTTGFAKDNVTDVKGPKTDRSIQYHDGPVLQGNSNIYLIFYGSWTTEPSETKLKLMEFILDLGSSQYFKINKIYSDSLGNTPSGILFYGLEVVKGSDSYGTELTEEDLQGIVSETLLAEQLPFDSQGIYLVLGTPDIGSDETGFCSSRAAAHHNFFQLYGGTIKYAFIGNPSRCPAVAAPQFVAPDGSILPTPNGNFVVDAMASSIASSLNAIVSNPLFTGWYDGTGAENSTKCAGNFGQTFRTPNGARANVRLQQRDYLIQQNWINSRIGYCATALP